HRRHAHSNLPRHLYHPGDVFCERALRTPAGQGGGAAHGRGRRRHRRRSGRITRSTGGARHGPCGGRWSRRGRAKHRSAAMKAQARQWMLIVVASAGLLAGCAVGPDYTRPPTTPPETFRGQTGPADAVSLADLPWWEVFRDATLQELLQTALANNYDLRVAVARVEQARALAARARGAFLPSIGYEGNIGRAHGGEFGSVAVLPGAPVSTQSSFLGLITASWEPDIWGRIRRQYEAARAQFLGTEEARRGGLLSLVSNVAQAYFALLELDAQLDIARRNTASFQSTYDLLQRRLGFGLASTLETSRAEGALGSAAETIPDLERQIAAQENQISVLLGRNPGPIPRGTSLFEQPVVPAVPAGLPSALLERRPDLRQAE